MQRSLTLACESMIAISKTHNNSGLSGRRLANFGSKPHARCAVDYAVNKNAARESECISSNFILKLTTICATLHHALGMRWACLNRLSAPHELAAAKISISVALVGKRWRSVLHSFEIKHLARHQVKGCESRVRFILLRASAFIWK